ncbi:MAG: GNAT family N-acetyltransferase [Stackebrandtia sp.]
MNVRIIAESFTSPVAQRLNDEVQAEYTRRYGEPDFTVIAAEDFIPPRGGYYIGYVDGEPVASIAWRAHGGTDAEMKRMYVVEAMRGNGIARAMIAHLEAEALAAGRTRMVLVTGDSQPEAVRLYAALGYLPVETFGYYADQEGAFHLGKSLVDEQIAAPATSGLGVDGELDSQ